ncbi:MAG: hypothetical protein EBS87_00825 [Sphingomonadaceae bacterium]|jgi:hypothetical protein|nr:hypothetical protein [Sphingomonadaceae bacterium]NBU78853.1 hypothetical protein [Sphingomonadaceae bacterium]NCA00729.1 hypothetical protein [Sphingomonadaceae bacterium]
MHIWVGEFKMHIAGRLALQSPACAVLPQRETGIAPNPDILSFHGCDIVVRHITEHGFEAELSTKLVEGALVRLRLPGAGAMIARVTASRCGHLVADFVNPVSASRLGKTLGMASYSRQVA